MIILNRQPRLAAAVNLTCFGKGAGVISPKSNGPLPTL